MRNATLGLIALGTCAACGSRFTAAPGSSSSSGGEAGFASGGRSGAGATSSAGSTSTSGGNATGGNTSGGTGSFGGGQGGSAGQGGGAGQGGVDPIGGSAGDSGGSTTGGDVAIGGGSGDNTGGASGSAGGGGDSAGSAGTNSGSACNSLKTTYLADLAKARLCDQGSLKQCSKSSVLPDACSCDVLVNPVNPSTAAAKLDLQAMQDASCSFAPCGTACVAITAASCSQQAHTMMFTCANN